MQALFLSFFAFLKNFLNAPKPLNYRGFEPRRLTKLKHVQCTLPRVFRTRSTSCVNTSEYQQYMGLKTFFFIVSAKTDIL